MLCCDSLQLSISKLDYELVQPNAENWCQPQRVPFHARSNSHRTGIKYKLRWFIAQPRVLGV